MAWLDLVLAVLFAALAVYYGTRVQQMKASGDSRRATWTVITTVLLAIAAVLFAVAFVLAVA